jgi:hypothetical protein
VRQVWGTITLASPGRCFRATLWYRPPAADTPVLVVPAELSFLAHALFCSALLCLYRLGALPLIIRTELIVMGASARQFILPLLNLHLSSPARHIDE